ncbi:MAG: hypothetical protein ACPGLV_00640 [Bacteroidia bacterium]
MKNGLIVLSIMLVLSACKNKSQQTPNLEGDLYYKWLKLGSFYNVPDSFYQKYLEYKDTKGTPYIEILEKHNLVKSPFIYLKTDADSIFIVYMEPDDYEPITEYNYQDLIDDKQKIRLKLKTYRISDKQQVCQKVISIEKINGETLLKEKKFKIEDYK